MRILFIPFGDLRTASTRVRCSYYAELIQWNTLAVTTVQYDWRQHMCRTIRESINSDVVWFQKVFGLRACVLFLIARYMLRKPTVYDIDDPLFLSFGRQSTYVARIYALAQRLWNSSSIFLFMKKCSVLTSESLTSYLEQIGLRACFLPNGIKSFSPPRGAKPDTKLRVGWIGHGPSYEEDLQMLIQPLTHLRGECEFILRLVGVHGSRRILESFSSVPFQTELVEDINWDSEEETMAMIRTFDIGVVPIIDSPYNWTRGSFKVDQMMAMGVPVVVSAVGPVLKYLIDGKNGFVAKSREDWVNKLSILLADNSRRHDIGFQGYVTALSEHSPGRCLDSVREILTRATSNPPPNGVSPCAAQ